jgi:hypothetical protein
MRYKLTLALIILIVATCALSEPLTPPQILLSQNSSSNEIEKQDYPKIDKEVKSVWKKFTQLLRAGDSSGALMLISEPSRKQYLEIFNDLGADIRNLPDTWSEIKLVTTFGQCAEYLVTRTDGSDKLMHTMLFVRYPDGNWYLDNF